MVAHFVHKYTTNIPLKVLFKFGQEVVILFFLLSGFVIYLAFTKRPDQSFRTYFIRRFRRIYFPIIVSFLLSFIISVVTIGSSIDFSWYELIGNVLMLQDFSLKPGNWFYSFMGNSPLWSLSYEWWFYMLFFPFFLIFYKIKVPFNSTVVVSSISLISWVGYLAIPNHALLVLSYFIIWWVGLRCAQVYIDKSDFKVSYLKYELLGLLIMSIAAFIPILLTDYKLGWGLYPIVMFRHFFSALIFLIVGLVWWKCKLKFFNRSIGLFSVFAPFSYSIYIFHFPILNLIIFEENSTISIISAIFLKLILIFSLSYLVDVILQPKVNKFFPAL